MENKVVRLQDVLDVVLHYYGILWPNVLGLIKNELERLPDAREDRNKLPTWEELLQKTETKPERDTGWREYAWIRAGATTAIYRSAYERDPEACIQLIVGQLMASVRDFERDLRG